MKVKGLQEAMGYQGDLDPNCLFCRWIRARKAVETLGTVAAFNDGYPVTKGHLLIVPFRHIADGFSMTEQEIRDSEALIRTLSEKISKNDASVTGFNIGIKTGADLKRHKKAELIRVFGKSGGYFYDIAHGLDDRPVQPDRIRKSIGKETTFSEDVNDTAQMFAILEEIAVKLENSLIKRLAKGRTITLKVKYFDFQSITRSVTVYEPVDSATVIMKHIKPLLSKTEAGKKKVRLLGISVSNFDDLKNDAGKYRQLPLPLNFPDGINTKNGHPRW